MKKKNSKFDFEAKSNFVNDLPFGEKYEDELKVALDGQMECKADRLCQKTGNVYVETRSRGKPSGINVTTAKYWAFCLWVEEREAQTWVIVPTKILKKLMTNYPIKKGGDNWTSKGYIIPKGDLLNQTI